MMMKSSGLQYTLREDGIHEFVFLQNGDETALDQFFQILATILQESEPDGILRYIVDVSHTGDNSGLGELVKRFRKLEVQYPQRAAGRTAILHSGTVMLTLASTIVDTLAPGKDRTRFFDITRREVAITWLLSET